MELADRLGVQPVIKQSSSMQEASSRAKIPTQSSPRSRSRKADVVVTGSAGPVETNAQALQTALTELGGGGTPAALFAQLGVSQEAVDSFYVALRELQRAGSVRIVRPDDAEVRIEAVH
jgi:hypothetical protein